MKYFILYALLMSASVQAMNGPIPNVNNIKKEPSIVYKNPIVTDNQEVIDYLEKTMTKIEENKTPPDKTIINIFNKACLFASCVLTVQALYISKILYIYYKNRY